MWKSLVKISVFDVVNLEITRLVFSSFLDLIL